MSNHKWIFCKVIRGEGRGRSLGFPTINLIIPEDFKYKEGVYAGWVRFEDEVYKGAFHFGSNITFNQSKKSLEVFILDEKISTSPESVGISLNKFIRHSKKFESKNDLIDQISSDVKKIRDILSENK